MKISPGLEKAQSFYHQRGWEMHPFQKRCFDAVFQGNDGLLNAATGSGKTYALAIPFLLKISENIKSLQFIWISPLRSLATEIQDAIASAARELGLNIQVAIRNGDSSPAERKRQKEQPPAVMVTTPESLHLMFTEKGSSQRFKNVKAIVVDEWHELLGTKRGVQTELAIAHIRHLSRETQVWGISATIGNLKEALEVLVPTGNDKVLIQAHIAKNIQMETLMPEHIEKFPWSGHLGIRLLPEVVKVIESSRSVLIFTNTRSQAELWYQYLLDYKPDLSGIMALHHGSLDREIREWVEQALENGYLKAVVCTSSLDLGVDFRPVDTVVQIGSPKGVARFIQRAGRSGHAPGLPSKIFFVPTHSLELIEAAALQQALITGEVEERIPVVRSFDVLVQYALTLATGDGLDPGQAYEEIRSTYAFSSIDEAEWNWLLDFIRTGGRSFSAYDSYQKVVWENGIFKVTNRRIAMQHRLSIGTIAFDTSMWVCTLSGKRIGMIEEYFISRLNAGDVFLFAGRKWELIRTEGTSAFVRKAEIHKKPNVPSWMGGRMSLSSEISALLRAQLNQSWPYTSAEMKKLEPLMFHQAELSLVPRQNQLLIEYYETDEGHHVFIYPFEGRMIHEGMSMLLSYRYARMFPATISMAANDYGFELLSDQPIDVEAIVRQDWFSTENLEQHLSLCTNYTEIARKKFSNIAAIGGLLFKGYPQKQQKSRHLQTSASLIFEVFRTYDPDQLLYKQAYEEALYNQLDTVRLRKCLQRIAGQSICIHYPQSISPLAFPIMVDRLREQLSNEKIEERMKRMVRE